MIYAFLDLKTSEKSLKLDFVGLDLKASRKKGIKYMIYVWLELKTSAKRYNMFRCAFIFYHTRRFLERIKQSSKNQGRCSIHVLNV